MSGTGRHPRHRLDEVIHSPVRFSIMATLASAEQAAFGFVRDLVEVSDSVLSRQVGLLQEAGYLAIRKGYVGKRPRTWLSLTESGRSAFQQHLAVLHEITSAVGIAASAAGPSAPAAGPSASVGAMAGAPDAAAPEPTRRVHQ